MRGVRVIVVVTNSVSTQRRGYGGFIIVIPYVLLLLALLLLLIRSSGFDVCSQISKLPSLGAETFLCAPCNKQIPCHHQKKSLKTDIYIS